MTFHKQPLGLKPAPMSAARIREGKAHMARVAKGRFTPRIQYDNVKRPARCWKHRGGPNRNGSYKDHVMAAKPLPPLAVLRQLFSYDPLAGHLTWKEQPRSWFPDTRAAKSWNTRYAGKIVGATDPRGYVIVRIKEQRFYAHRIVWAMITGSDAILDIDHINGNKSDNRDCNLRECNNTDNSKNSKLNSNNTSGICGVTWDKKNNKWKAYARSHGKMHNLGRFDRLEDAASARKTFSREHGFSSSHGERQ